MPHNIIENKYGEVLKCVAGKVKDAGFSGHGPVFRILREGNCGLIEFQKSQTNTEERLLFTVNVGIVCGSLLGEKSDKLEKVRIIDAHISERLGMFLPERDDKWWEITSQTEVGFLAAELSELIVTKAVPYILSLINTSAIVSLWQSGKSPGLTKGQRLRFLSRLTSPSEEPQ